MSDDSNPIPTVEAGFGRVRMVLVGTQHPGNIGSAARALKTMGFSRLVLVAPERFPHAEADALAAGAGDVLETARVLVDPAEAVADCRLVLGCTARAVSAMASSAWRFARVNTMAPSVLIRSCQRSRSNSVPRCATTISPLPTCW